MGNMKIKGRQVPIVVPGFNRAFALVVCYFLTTVCSVSSQSKFLFPSASAGPAEMLTNPGFEASFELLPSLVNCPEIVGEIAHSWFDNSCWEGNESAEVSYVEDTENPHSGASSQRIQVQVGIMQIGQLVPFQAGKLYTSTIWMRSQEPMNVTILLRQSEFPYTYFAQKTVSLSSQWVQYGVDGMTTATEGFFMIFSDSEGTIWLDDASLIATDRPPTSLPVDPVPNQYFGIHIHSQNLPWPHDQLNIGAVRLWDASGDNPPNDDAQWAAINIAPGTYNWTTLDLHVARAQAQGAEIVFNLGRTPSWASARPNEFSPYGNGQAAEPADDQYWRDWVLAVATRYRGRITHWEIWNEPNDEWFWTGSTARMVELAGQAYSILKTIDSENLVVSPSPYDLGFLTEYLSLGGGDFADIIGYHFYLVEGEEPEHLYQSYVPVVKYIMESHGQGSKSLFDTENGWPGWPLSNEVAASYLARSYMLEWAAGVERFFFYSWDNGEPVIFADPPDYQTLNSVGLAYAQLSSWLIGSTMEDISTGDDDTWTIQMVRSDGFHTFAVWNPQQTVAFDIPFSWGVQQMTDLAGNVIDLGGATQVTVNHLPVLFFGSSLVSEISDKNPTRSSFIPNSPNPFNASTIISFVLPNSRTVSLKIYDARGRLVDTLFQNESLSGGIHQVEWKGIDLAGNSVSSGVYFSHLETGDESSFGKLVLVK